MTRDQFLSQSTEEIFDPFPLILLLVKFWGNLVFDIFKYKDMRLGDTVNAIENTSTNIYR